MFLFAYLSFKLQKCKPVNFSRSHLACMDGRHISVFQHVIITEGWLACQHVHVAKFEIFYYLGLINVIILLASQPED